MQVALYHLPQTTVSHPAHTLLAILRYYPGYSLAQHSPQRVNWTVQSLLALAEDRPELFHDYLPEGCISAVYELSRIIPFVPCYTKELSMETICGLIISLATYHRKSAALLVDFKDKI